MERLRPMSQFDPSKPAVLHDDLNDKMIAWTGEQADHWHRYAHPHDDGGIIEWDGLLIDGWVEPRYQPDIEYAEISDEAIKPGKPRRAK